jgi:hypothetical protein
MALGSSVWLLEHAAAVATAAANATMAIHPMSQP